jgi:dimethylamine/trimethylamine dehydrogenase
MAEEWRRGWHPEQVPKKGSDARVLVVGAGPAGLEAARTAGARGYEVALAEAGRELGGHLNAFARLPGLAEWIRVRDWRIGQIGKMANVTVYRESELTADHVREFGFEHVIVATGASWRRDGVGTHNYRSIAGHDRDRVLTPDDVMAGSELRSPVVIFDNDSYVMGGCLAEKLVKEGHDVTLVTPFAQVSPWLHFTLELVEIQRRLASLSVTIHANYNLAAIDEDGVELSGVYGEPARRLEAGSVVLVTMRSPNEALYHDLVGKPEALTAARILSVRAVGDCFAPAQLSEAVFGGHEAARALDEPDVTDLPFRVEQVPASFEPPFPWHKE